MIASLPKSSAPGARFVYEHRLELVIAFFLALGTLAVFGWSCAHDFVNYDDDVYVTDNRHVQGGLTPSNIRWAFTTFYASNWHPLTWLALQLDAQIYGMRPAGFHLT